LTFSACPASGLNIHFHEIPITISRLRQGFGAQADRRFADHDHDPGNLPMEQSELAKHPLLLYDAGITPDQPITGTGTTMQPTHLHFDCYCGISGDMTLGALVDLGLPVDELQEGLQKLPIGPFSLRAEKIKRQGIMGTRVHVTVEEEPHVHQHLRHIREIVEAADLPPVVVQRSMKAYTLLAEAEAHVHGSTPEKIHFHEVGAKDAIVDIAGAMLGFHRLGIETFSVTRVTTGSGTVQCQHGEMPVPAPATVELLRGIPHAPGSVEKEMTTPTGAAILAAVVRDNPGGGSVPPPDHTLVIDRTGYGGGSRELKNRANYLRVFLCEPPGEPSTGAAAVGPVSADIESIMRLECEMDDATPEQLGYVLDRLMHAGALDVHYQPVQMKKNRPGQRLTLLCSPDREASLVEKIFRETSTFGIRRQETQRWALRRRREKVETRLGSVSVKLGLWGDDILKIMPEYENCIQLAEEHNLPLGDVYRVVQAAIDQQLSRPES
jgi:uncharacterized protein (TIGR00299 family) protein